MLLWPDPRTAPMPLFAELKMVSYNTKIWGTFYNYSHPVIYQVFEVRYCPIIASAAFASAAFTLLIKKTDNKGCHMGYPQYIFKGTCINASENKIYKMADHENA